MIAEQHVLALPAGYQLGKYLFKGVLGSGGFGITYLAEDITLNRKVAVKEMLPNDFATRIDGTTVVAKTESEKPNLTWARARFVDEGRALAACDHPNVVNVYEMIEANGTAYMVTKYEEGCSLERWLRDLGRAPSESELREILVPLLSGLERVHRAGFLHRDIKPDNIYLTTDGRPVLLDFGSARQAITGRSMVMTSIVSTGYAPFEQYHEDGKQGPWSDIYALGAVMYRAITGSKPPEAVRRLQNDPCQKLATSYTGRYDVRFLAAIDRALNVNESQRPQSVADWRDMIESTQAFPALGAASPPRGEQRGKNIAGTKGTAKAFPKQIAVGVGALLLIATGAWFFARPKPPVLADATVYQSAGTGKQTSGEQPGPKQEPRNDQSPPKGQPASAEQPPPKDQQASVEQPPPKDQHTSAEQPPPKDQHTSAEQPPPKDQHTSAEQQAPREQQASAEQPPSKGRQAPAEQPPSKGQQAPADQPPPKDQQAAAEQPPSKGQQVPVDQPPSKDQQASAEQPPSKGQQTVDQPAPKERQQPSSGQPVRSHESPSPNAVAIQEPSPEKAVRAEESQPGQQVAIQQPPNEDEPQSTPTTQTPKLETKTLPVASNPANSGPATDATTVDPKLVGTWEGKPNGSKAGWERQWEQQPDGSYAISGTLTETGNLTASDGKIEKYLDGAQEPSEVLYKFVGNTLITMDPDGGTTVWRLVSGKQKSEGTKTSASPTRHSRHTGQSSGHSPGIIHEIRRFLPF